MKKPVLGRTKRTNRGFDIIEFPDHNSFECSLQASSLAIYAEPGTSAVWLGRSVPEEERMHLDRRQIEALINHLQRWLKAGTFKLLNKKLATKGK